MKKQILIQLKLNQLHVSVFMQLRLKCSTSSAGVRCRRLIIFDYLLFIVSNFSPADLQSFGCLQFAYSLGKNHLSYLKVYGKGDRLHNSDLLYPIIL